MTPHGVPAAGVAERLWSFQRSSQHPCKVHKGTLNGMKEGGEEHGRLRRSQKEGKVQVRPRQQTHFEAEVHAYRQPGATRASHSHHYLFRLRLHGGKLLSEGH